MRIAVVVNTSWNIFNFRMGLVNRLIESGHEVIAIAPKDAYSANIIAAGCEYINLTMDSRGVNPIKDAALTIELFRIYKRINPDVILHFTIKPNIYGTLAARFLKIPVINNVSGLGTVFLWDNFASKVALWMYKIAFKSANFVFFQNREDEKHFIDKVGIRNMQSGILPGSGIDISVFKPNGYVKNEDFTFILIARLLIDKGIEEFVEAVRILKKKGLKARFLVFGNIEANHKRAISIDKVSAWAKEGIIEYKGVTDNIREQVGHSDCVVLPSYREGTPRTLLEGGSMAKPLIATDVPGCNNVVISGYNGLLCNAKDSAHLAKQMEHLMSLPTAEIEAMGQNSRKLVVEKYDENIVIDKYESAIKQVMSNSVELAREEQIKTSTIQSRAATINL